MNDSTSSSRWANLHYDLLLDIIERVDDSRWPSDFRRRLLSVCTSWRSAVSPPPPREQPKFRIKFPGGTKSYYVKESTYYIMFPLPHLCTKTSSTDSKQGWIIRVDEAEGGTWRLISPIEDNLSLFNCTPPIRAEINLLDYQFRELTRSYTLVDERTGRKLSQKVAVLLSPKDDGVFATIMAITCNKQLAFRKTGETKWKLFSTTEEFARIISFKGKFYAADTKGEVFKIDSEDVSKYTTVSASPEIWSYTSVHFVECQGCLYYIEHYYEYPLSVNMFVLNEEHCRWDKVTSFKDRVFFILREASFAIPAHDLDRDTRGGWIYIEERGRHLVRHVSSSLTSRLEEVSYTYYDKSLDCMCVDEDQRLYLKLPSDMVFFSFVTARDKGYECIFFPPPPWIEWRCPARDNAIISMTYLSSGGEK